MASAHPLWLYGHRGACAELPENTLEAFERALEAGADAIETDCHVTRDGHVVVHHDPTGRRMAGTDAAVADCTLDEVRTWDVGWGFVGPDGDRPHAGRGFRAPTLAEVLAALPDTRLNIDVKSRVPGALARVIAVVREHDAEGRVLLTSFDAATVRALVRAGYRGPIGSGLGQVLRAIALPRALLRRWPLPGVAAQIPERQGPLRLGTPYWIAKLHACGLRVDFWTINDPATARRLLEAGADGIMTDDPATIAPVVAHWRENTDRPQM